MITLSWYLLKVIICSGILCGYYFLALRNKAFHRWNRFYILAAIIISLLAPVMKINIFQNDADKGTVVHVLQTISYGDEAVIEYSRNNQFHLSTHNLGEVAYVLVSAIFLAIFFVSLYKIKRLRKKYPETKIEEVSFINTNAKGTPFSFFNSIFWNNAIDLHSKSGQQIFNHEIAHVKEKHSYDKIFMNIVLIFFWINPFFWLMRKELYMIHEFIADKEALEDSDVSAFAEMVLQTVYPGQKFSLNNQFFYSPLKRRIMMLTKNKNPKVNYISRLLVLPLAAIVFFAFTLKVKNRSNNLYHGKTITVIIDAGHGGSDDGASSADGIKEKDISLSIAKKIAALNSNSKINILLSRDNDQYISVKDRVLFAKNNNADIFISIHVNGSVNKQLNGFSIFIGRNNEEQNQLLGSALIKELKESYKTEDKIAIRNKGLMVLNSSACPAAIVECGFLTNSADAAFISKSDDQEKIAENILNAINIYASSEENEEGKSLVLTDGPSIINDTIPDRRHLIPSPIYYKGKKLKYIQFIENGKNVEATYYDDSKEIITPTEAEKRGFIPLRPQPGVPSSYFKSNALFVIDGKISTSAKARQVNPKDIQSVNILKDKKATDKYGQKGKDGVIEITTKNNGVFSATADTVYIGDRSSSKPPSDDAKFAGNVIFIKSKFPDNTLIFADGKEISQDEMKNIPPNTIQSVNVLKGESAEKKYGEKGKNGAIEITTKYHIPPNTLIIVDGKESTREGLDKIQTSNIESITILKDNSATIKYGIAGKDEVIEITTKKNLPMLSLIDTIPNKVFIKVENEASFPGGLHAWSKYISKAIQDSISNFTEADYGTCVIRFIVNTDGRVSDVIATTMKGTELAKVSINAIKKGPKWIPASQDGRTVAAYRLQPVTLSNPDNKEKTIKFLPPKIVRDSGNVYVNPDGLAKFPGGHSAWLKYISQVINKYGNELTANKNNIGTCKVKFVVGTNGKVSEVHATTMEGTELAKVAVNAIKDGPDWIPGKQNGRAVNSFLIQPVAFSLSDELTVKGQILKVTH